MPSSSATRETDWDRIDDDLYTSFRHTWPDLNIKNIDIEQFKSNDAKSKWRDWLPQWHEVVQDATFATLLRLNSEFDLSEENSFIVTRVQFYAVEIARNREGLNIDIKDAVE